MGIRIGVCAMLAGARRAAALAAMLGLAASPLPAPAQGFLPNFLKPHYLVPVLPLDGTANSGDLNATYQQILVPRRDSLELLILGEYPRARYFSLVVYDDHGAIVGVLEDKDIQPLLPGTANPYAPGGTAGAEDILYAVRVRLGAARVTNPISACSLGTLEANVNPMDGSSRHTAYDFYSCQHSGFTTEVPSLGPVAHDDGIANRGITVMLRQYLPQGQAPESTFDLTRPAVFLRRTETGCAVPLAPAGQPVPESTWYKPWQVASLRQVVAHGTREGDLGLDLPWGVDPLNGLKWFGSQEYILKSLPERYLSARVPFDPRSHPHAPAQLNAEGRVLAFALRLPRMPCATFPDCAPPQDEQLRYWSLSFVRNDGTTEATISDADLTPDGDGYVSLIVSFGTPLPPHVNPDNGYSVVTLPEFDLKRIDLRNLQPAATFGCSTSNVPPRVSEHHPNGGFMGEYAPFVGFPEPAALPQTAVPLPQGGSCVPPAPYVPQCP